ncbi:MAG: carboxypeptidase-like regulatory domain-containing protein, partial [bacterium]
MKKLFISILSMVIIFSTGKTIKAEVYGSISGRVYVEQTGEGKEGFRIQVLKGDNLESVNWLNIAGLRGTGELDKYGETKTDKNGNYSFNLLPPGKYLIVIVEKPLKYYFENFHIVNLEEGKNITNYDIKLSKLGSIGGKVYKTDGVNPLENYTIWSYDGEKTYLEVGKAAGEFLIEGLPPKEHWQLFIKYKGYLYTYDSSVNTMGSIDIKDLRIVVKEDNPTGIFGQVTAPDGLPLKDAYVYVKSENEVFRGSADIDSTGSYSIKGLPSAKYYLSIYKRVEDKYIDFLDSPIELANGQQIERNYIYDSTKEKEVEMIITYITTERIPAELENILCKKGKTETGSRIAFTTCYKGKIVRGYCESYDTASDCMKKVYDFHEDVHVIQYTENKVCEMDDDERKKFLERNLFWFELEAFALSDVEEEKCTGKKPPCRVDWLLRRYGIYGSGVSYYSEYSCPLPDLGTYRPDESFSVSSNLPPQVVDYYKETPDGTLLLQGASDLMGKLLSAVKKSMVLTDINTYFPNLLQHSKVLVIPSGGLIGLDNSQAFKDNLAEFANQGGVVVCFSQPNGYEFSALPGGQVGGYGWGEDQACHSNAVYINTYHPVLSG